MLQKTFSIYSDDLNDVRLFIETGKNHIACWCRKNNDDVLRAFEFFQYGTGAAENFEQLLNNAKLYSRLLTMPVAGTVFLWNTDEVICVPKQMNDAVFLKQNFELLKGGRTNTIIFSEDADACTVAWRVNAADQQAANESFTGALFMHQFIALLPALQYTEANSIYLFFYPHYFTLCLLINKKLHYINTVNYTTPEDVLYFILNVCQQYQIENTLALYCGGFITENSKLYETLHQYLEGFQLLKPATTLFAGDEFKEQPPHFFTPYINYVV